MSKKKEIRRRFRESCFERDKYCCVKCGFKSSKDRAEQELDAHHITPRTEMPNGGYVKENGISLCSVCHVYAEEFYSTGIAHKGYSVEELYLIINSSLEEAIKASNKLIL
jgi:CRISPR-associated protein Cas8b1/Cst1 subtype I-B